MNFTSSNNNNPYILATSPEELDTGAKGSDRYLLMVIIGLMMIGLLAIYSAIAFFAETKETTAGSLVAGHGIKMIIAFIVMIFFSKIDYHLLAKFSRIAVLLSWIFLIVVMVAGTQSFGARRWLNIGGFSFQPSSFASVALIIQVSVLMFEKQDYIKDFKRSFLPTLLWVFGTCALIGLEDFSSAGLLLVTCLCLMFVGRIHLGHLAGLILLGILGGAGLIALNPERANRINNYFEQAVHLKSDEFALGEGYQAQQAHIAIARGDLFGVGIGKSSQRDFLPAPYNDFIFAIIAEEYGLMGAAFLMCLFAFILIRGIGFIARLARDELGVFIATGATLYVCFLGFINAGVASGLLPVTGLPMPFVSYGGTSMLFSGVLVGILLNISKQKRK